MEHSLIYFDYIVEDFNGQFITSIADIMYTLPRAVQQKLSGGANFRLDQIDMVFTDRAGDNRDGKEYTDDIVFMLTDGARFTAPLTFTNDGARRSIRVRLNFDLRADLAHTFIINMATPLQSHVARFYIRFSFDHDELPAGGANLTAVASAA